MIADKIEVIAWDCLADPNSCWEISEYVRRFSTLDDDDDEIRFVLGPNSGRGK